MAKKSGFFSWFKKSEPEAKQPAPEAEELTSELESQNHDPQTAEAESSVSAEGTLEPVELDVKSETSSKPSAEEILETPNESLVPVSPVPETVELPEALETELVTESETDAQQEGELEQETETAKPDSSELQNVELEAPEPAEKKVGFFERLKRGLSKTRAQIGGGFLSLFKGKEIDDELYEELETQLLMADVGMDTTMKLIARLTDHADRKQLKDGDALYALLKNEMSEILKKADSPLAIDNADGAVLKVPIARRVIETLGLADKAQHAAAQNCHCHWPEPSRNQATSSARSASVIPDTLPGGMAWA